MQFRFSRDDARPSTGTAIHLRKIQPGVAYMFTILSPHWEGFWMHYSDKRTFPCTRDAETCQMCKDKWPAKWRGYCHVSEHGDDGGECLLELTPLAAERLEKLQEDRTSLRGMMISVKRRDKNPRSPLVLGFLGMFRDAGKLLHGRSAEPTLKRFWGIC